METIRPKFSYLGPNANYGPGYIGFLFRDNNIFSKGIAYFQRNEIDDTKISHSFIVRDEDVIIEATIHGVRYWPISKYINDPHIAVVFKKPISLDSAKSTRIVTRAELHIGQKYDTSLFLYFIKKYFIDLFCDNPRLDRRASIFDSPNEWICSELVADALTIDYSSFDPLNRLHPSKIDPITLFNSEIFKEWKFAE